MGQGLNSSLAWEDGLAWGGGCARWLLALSHLTDDIRLSFETEHRSYSYPRHLPLLAPPFVFMSCVSFVLKGWVIIILLPYIT